MFKVTMAGLRAHKSRLVAVSLAVALATAFMSATFLLSASANATLVESLGAEYKNADLVFDGYNPELGYFNVTGKEVQEIANFEGIQQTAAKRNQTVALSSAKKKLPFVYITNAAHEKLDSSVMLEGKRPAGIQEIALDESTAQHIQADLNDEITITVSFAEKPLEISTKIVGIIANTNNPFMGGIDRAIVDDEAFDELFGIAADSTNQNYELVLMKLKPGFTIDQINEQLKNVEFRDGSGQILTKPVKALTPEQKVNLVVKEFSDGNDILTAVLLSFVAIALFVAGLVISNTFSVLVAQRSRELALLRCIGASSRQVRKSILGEALIMSLIASTMGVALAVGVMAALIWIAQIMEIASGVATFGTSWHAFVWPIVAGVVVTLIAASGPAREATRVAPLEVMRTKSVDQVTKKAGKVRLVAGLVIITIAGAIVFYALTLDQPDLALLLALAGCSVSAVGILMLMVFIVPKLTHAFGSLTLAKSVPGRLAALNSKRNPKRTSATASALLIGVTLVSTVYTGAEVARATITNELRSAFPIDVAVVTEGDEIDEQTVSEISNLDGVEKIVLGKKAPIEMEEGIYTVWGFSPADYGMVGGDKSVILKNGEALIGVDTEKTELTFSSDGGSATLKVVSAGAPSATAILTLSDFSKVSNAEKNQVALLKVSENLDAASLLELRDELTGLVNESYVIGEGIERNMFEAVLQVLLLIVTALLAVAILIAVIGIGNTLSLSVIERIKENALLRALGVTKGQLRWMLAAEALLTAVITALLGMFLGVIYGFIGASTVLIGLETIQYVIPWKAMTVILLASLTAGLVSSILPSKRATRLTPVEGLRAV